MHEIRPMVVGSVKAGKALNCVRVKFAHSYTQRDQICNIWITPDVEQKGVVGSVVNTFLGWAICFQMFKTWNWSNKATLGFASWWPMYRSWLKVFISSVWDMMADFSRKRQLSCHNVQSVKEPPFSGWDIPGQRAHHESHSLGLMTSLSHPLTKWPYLLGLPVSPNAGTMLFWELSSFGCSCVMLSESRGPDLTLPTPIPAGVHTYATVLGSHREGYGTGNDPPEPVGLGKSHTGSPPHSFTIADSPPQPWQPCPLCVQSEMPSPSCSLHLVLHIQMHLHFPKGFLAGAGGANDPAGSTYSLPYGVFLISLDFPGCSWEKCMHLVFKYYIFKNADFDDLTRFRKTQSSVYTWILEILKNLGTERNFLNFIWAELPLDSLQRILKQLANIQTLRWSYQMMRHWQSNKLSLLKNEMKNHVYNKHTIKMLFKKYH